MAGFDRAVLIIRHQIEREVTDHLRERPSPIPVDLAYQDDLGPARDKPWGTSHALLRPAITSMHRSPSSTPTTTTGPSHWSSPPTGSRPRRTPASSGTRWWGSESTARSPPPARWRGACARSTTKDAWCASSSASACAATPTASSAPREPDEVEIADDALASMNLWCFPMAVYDRLATGWKEFHAANAEEPRAEFLLPEMVGRGGDQLRGCRRRPAHCLNVARRHLRRGRRAGPRRPPEPSRKIDRVSICSGGVIPSAQVEFGIFNSLYLPHHAHRGRPASAEHNRLMDEVEWMRAADRAGFKYTWATEHHFLTSTRTCRPTSRSSAYVAALTEPHPHRHRHLQHHAAGEPPGPHRRAGRDARSPLRGPLRVRHGPRVVDHRAARLRHQRSRADPRDVRRGRPAVQAHVARDRLLATRAASSRCRRATCCRSRTPKPHPPMWVAAGSARHLREGGAHGPRRAVLHERARRRRWRR